MTADVTYWATPQAAGRHIAPRSCAAGRKHTERNHARAPAALTPPRPTRLKLEFADARGRRFERSVGVLSLALCFERHDVAGEPGR